MAEHGFNCRFEVYCKAKAAPGYRFYSLFGELLRRDIIETAMSAVASHAGAAGVDGQECSAYTRSDEAWHQWRDTLLAELRAKTFRVSPVRRVRIPKGEGKTRPLGIPTVKDRVVQTAAALLLPVWEADSHPQSYAYRPKRNAQQAMDAIKTALLSGRTEVIDADLSGYFDTIPHRELLRPVARRVNDGRLLALIKAWLRAPIVERHPDTGRPTITGIHIVEANLEARSVTRILEIDRGARAPILHLLGQCRFTAHGIFQEPDFFCDWPPFQSCNRHADALSTRERPKGRVRPTRRSR